MKLYSCFNSSTSYRVRIALALKGIEYQYHGVNLRIGEQSDTDYIAINPSKGVPVLIDADGSKITQSLAILYCVGDESTLADVDLIPQIANALRMGCDVPHYPHAMAMYQHCTALPAFQVATPQQQADC